MISSRGTTAEASLAAASGSCPSTRAPLRVSPAGTSLLLPPLQISIPRELLSSPLPAPLLNQRSFLAGGRNFRERCLIPWGSASVELSREQTRAKGEGGGRRRREEGGKVFSIPQRSLLNAPRCFSNGMAISSVFIFNAVPPGEPGGAGGASRGQPCPNSACTEGPSHGIQLTGRERAFHVQNKGERGLFFAAC